MKRAATYSDDQALRWTLTRDWSAGEKPRTVCYIGHNPSTAGHEVDDPTSQAWVHFADANGFNRYVAVNLYPYRTPDVRACHEWAAWDKRGPCWSTRDLIMVNERVIVQQAVKADIIVACWGALPIDTSWSEQVIEAIQCHGIVSPAIYCLGTTGAGHPKHAMARGVHRIPRSQKFIEWRAA